MKAEKRIATVWLSGCTGCHMSFLDLDERLMELPQKATMVYSPLADIKTYPEDVDIAFVEGAVATRADDTLLRAVRAHTRLLVAFGDCAVTGNITAMRNAAGRHAALTRAYGDAGDLMGRDSDASLPALLEPVVPVHRVVDVDFFLQGCPPSPELIWYVFTELIEDRIPVIDREKLRYG